MQGLLWETYLLAELKIKGLLNVLPTKIRYYTTASLCGRVEFNPPIEKDDILSGFSMVYLDQYLKNESNVVESIQDISKRLREEINGKTHLYDFLALTDSAPPARSTVSTTCGVLDNRIDYKEFQVKDSVFISLPELCVNQKMMVVHTYTYKGLGCYFCCSYIEPHYHKDEAELFLNNIIKLIKTICNDENRNMTINEIIKIMD